MHFHEYHAFWICLAVCATVFLKSKDMIPVQSKEKREKQEEAGKGAKRIWGSFNFPVSKQNILLIILALG